MMMAHAGTSALGTNEAGWGSMSDMMESMMLPYQNGGGRVFWGLHWILGLATWILIVAVLVALVRWLWKKGNKIK